MDPTCDHFERITRRHFFGRTGLSLGAAALSTLLAEEAPAGVVPQGAAAATGGLPGLPHFAPKAKRAIYLHHERGPLADGSLRLQAQDGRHVRQGPARLGPQGPAAHHHDQRPDPVSRSPRRSTSSRSTAKSGMWVSELLPWTARLVDQIALRQDRLHRGDQPRPGRHLYLHRPPAPGPAEPRRLAQLRPGHREPEPAGVRRDDRLLVRARQLPGPLQPPLGIRLSAQQAPGRGPSLQRRPGAVPLQPAGRRRRRRAARMLDALGRLNQKRVRARSPTPRRRRASPSTRWPSACRPRCPS